MMRVPFPSAGGRCQRGLTIVEVMIALTIGLFLLGGTIALFVNNKRTYSEQDQLSRLQENARFALNLILRDARLAGFAGCNATSSLNNAVDGTDGVTDTLVLAYVTPPADLCSPGFAGATVTHRYHIRDQGGVPHLWQGDAVSDGNPMVEGVENLQVLYGVDNNNDQIPDTYADAAAVGNMAQVVSLKIGLLVRTPSEYGSDTDAQTYNLFTGGRGCAVGTDAGCVNPGGLRVRRRVYSTTVEIRNRTMTPAEAS